MVKGFDAIEGPSDEELALLENSPDEDAGILTPTDDVTVEWDEDDYERE